MVDERRYDSCGNPRSLVSHKHKSCFDEGNSDEDFDTYWIDVAREEFPLKAPNQPET